MEDFVGKLKAFCKNSSIAAEIAVASAPAYISHLFPNDSVSEVILVHKKRPIFSESIADINISLTNDISRADITGNPLEAPFDDVSILRHSVAGHVFDKEVTVLPPGLDIVDVRTIISYYNMHAENPSLAIWVVIDDALEEEDEDYNLKLMSSEKRDSWLISGVVFDNGEQDIEPIPNGLFSKHEKFLSKKTAKKLCTVNSCYKRTHLFREDESSSVYCTCSLIMNWDYPIYRPSPTLDTLIVNLSIECEIASGHSSLQFAWDQLVVLSKCLNCLNQRQPLQSQKFPNDQVLRHLPSSFDSCLRTRLDNVLQHRILQPSTKLTSPTSELLMNYVSEVSSPSYEKMDTLWTLWYLLLECSSFQELFGSIAMIQSETIENPTGKLMANINACTSICSANNDEGLLKVFIEMGLEKLNKEIISIFSVAEMSSQDLRRPELPKLKNIHLSCDWMKMADTYLGWLAQSVCLLELLTNSQRAVNLPNEGLHHLAVEFYLRFSEGTKEIRNVDWFLMNPQQRLSCDIPPLFVRDHLKDNPEEWIMSLTTTDNNEKVDSKFYFGIRRTMVPPESESFDENATVNISLSKADSFKADLWGTEVHLMQRKFL